MAQTTMTVDTAANKCCDRLKHGKEVTQFIIDQVKARIELETDYASKLLKISQQEETSGKMFGIVGKKGATVTTGTLGASLQTFLTTTQHVAKIHQDMKETLIISLQALHDFAFKQEHERKPLAEYTAKLHKQLQTNYSKMNDSRADRKSKEEKLNEKRTERDMIPKDSGKYDKAYKNWERADKALESAKTQQVNDEGAYNEARKQWEEHSADTYLRFKDMERDRIHNLRCALWRFANTQSVAAVATDEQSAVLRDSLRNCRSSIDIKEVIPVPDKADVSVSRSPTAKPPTPEVLQRSQVQPAGPKPPQPPIRPTQHPLLPHHRFSDSSSTSNGGASGEHRTNTAITPTHSAGSSHRPQHQMSVDVPDAHHQVQAKIAEELKELKLRSTGQGSVKGPRPGLRRMPIEEQMANGETSPPFDNGYTKL